MDTSGQLREGDHMPTLAASLVTVKFWNNGSVGLGIGTARAWPKAGDALAQTDKRVRLRLRERRGMRFLPMATR
jgi:hypothetical protein